MPQYYAGIGSRETPTYVLEYFVKIAAYLASKGFILRSGGDEGADKSFEIGCDKMRGYKEIYLPWKGFEKSSSPLIVSDVKAFEIAEQFHPNWNRLSDGAKKLQARNSHQVLGWDLETPSSFVICWTKNGKGQGGTGQALRIAKHYGIPIFDAGSYITIEETKKAFKEFLLGKQFITENDIQK